MTARFGEELWYLLTLFHRLGYMALFVLLMVWIRILLQVLEDALMPRQKTSHKFVHPIPLPPNLALGSGRDTAVSDEPIEKVELIADEEKPQEEGGNSIGIVSYYPGSAIRRRQLTPSTTRRMLG